MSVSFAPLFLWILIIALACFAVFAARRVDTRIGRGKWGWLLVIYFAVLLCSPVVLRLLPPESFAAPVDAATLRKVEAAARDLFPAAMAGRPESVDGVRKLGEWRLNLTGDSLIISGTYPYSDLNVFVERKDENNGVIEATHYFSGAILEMIDFSAQVRPVEISLVGNNLIISEPKRHIIKVSRFWQDSMAVQILGDGTARRHLPLDVTGEQLLYLRIPQGVQIEKSHYPLQFVNEDQP